MVLLSFKNNNNDDGIANNWLFIHTSKVWKDSKVIVSVFRPLFGEQTGLTAGLRALHAKHRLPKL